MLAFHIGQMHTDPTQQRMRSAHQTRAPSLPHTTYKLISQAPKERTTVLGWRVGLEQGAPRQNARDKMKQKAPGVFPCLIASLGPPLGRFSVWVTPRDNPNPASMLPGALR
ncbi:hypothetical protein V2G26_020778 [Clonostachys chloroleuca]